MPAITAWSTDTNIVGDKVTSDNKPVLSGSAEPYSRVQVLRNTNTSLVQLYKALGGGWQLAPGG